MRAILTAIITAGMLSGCAGSAAPPQVSPRDSLKLYRATGAISVACGELYQLRAFAPPPSRRRLDSVTAPLKLAIRRLADVEGRTPSAIYQGASVVTIVNQARTMLRACGLMGQAQSLERATARR